MITLANQPACCASAIYGPCWLFTMSSQHGTCMLVKQGMADSPPVTDQHVLRVAAMPIACKQSIEVSWQCILAAVILPELMAASIMVPHP